MSATWQFDAVDINGLPLTEGGLTLATNIEMNFQLVAPDTFTCMLPLTSPEAQSILTEGVDAYIKGYRTPDGGNPATSKVLRFYGPVWIDQVIGQNGVDQLMIGALDPSIILKQRFALNNYTASDCGAIIQAEVDRTNSTDGETGIRTNASNISASSSINCDNRQSKPSIMSLAEQFAGQLDGCEIWTVPIELAAGKICDLYASIQKGSAGTTVFSYGDTTEANCSAMGRTRDKSKMSNVVNGYAGSLTSQKTDATSIAAFRALVEYTSFTTETDQTTLDARSQGRIDSASTKAKVAEYTAQPASNAPQLFDDFNVGDTTYLHFKKGIEWGVNQRIYNAKLAVSNGGWERLAAMGFRAS